MARYHLDDLGWLQFTTSLRSSITERLAEALPDCAVLLWGCSDVCDMLDGCPHIRVAFPQLLSLRDLEAILSNTVNKVVIERSRAAVEEAEEISTVFFPTKAYYEALASLQKYGFVVLTGPPEVRKTAIARIIGLAKHAEGWQTAKRPEAERQRRKTAATSVAAQAVSLNRMRAGHLTSLLHSLRLP